MCTCGRVYVRTVCTGGHRFTCEFVVGVVAAVEIHVRACIMCRPWTQICRLFFGSATIINIIHKSTCVRVCVCLCVKCLSEGRVGIFKDYLQMQVVSAPCAF